MFGYMRPAHVPACHRGFVTGVLVVQGETPQGWSQTTERNAVYAERLVLSQAGTPIPLLRNKLMRSEAWVEGFQSGVLYEGRDNASQEGVG
jgi:hypothetical protein